MSRMYSRPTIVVALSLLAIGILANLYVALLAPKLPHQEWPAVRVTTTAASPAVADRWTNCTDKPTVSFSRPIDDPLVADLAAGIRLSGVVECAPPDDSVWMLFCDSGGDYDRAHSRCTLADPDPLIVGNHYFRFDTGPITGGNVDMLKQRRHLELVFALATNGAGTEFELWRAEVDDTRHSRHLAPFRPMPQGVTEIGSRRLQLN